MTVGGTSGGAGSGLQYQHLPAHYLQPDSQLHQFPGGQHHGHGVMSRAYVESDVASTVDGQTNISSRPHTPYSNSGRVASQAGTAAANMSSGNEQEGQPHSYRCTEG